MKNFQHLILIILAALFSLCFIGKTDGQNTSVESDEANLNIYSIDSFQHTLPLKDYVQMLEDPDDQYSITDVLRSDIKERFQSVKKTGKYFYQTEDRPWGKISLKNNLPYLTSWGFSFHFLTDSTLVYIVDKNGNIEALKIGQQVPLKEIKNGSTLLNETHNRSIPVFFSLNQGEQKDFYFKVFPKKDAGFEIVPQLRSMESVYKYQSEKLIEYIKVFFYLGLVWMFFLYNFLIYCFYKDKAYLYLSLYAFCFTLPSNVLVLYFIKDTWSANFPFIMDIKWIVLNPLIFIAISYFSQALLNTKKKFPKVNKYIKAIIWIGWGLLTLNISDYLISQYHSPVRLNNYLLVASIAVFILFLFIVKELYRQKNTIVRFWISGMSFLIFFQLMGNFLTILSGDAVYWELKSFLGNLSLLDIGLLGQIAIFTLGAGYRSREIAEEKKELEEMDQLKSRFFANISHEFRTPLTLMMGPLKEVIENTEDPINKSLLEMAHRNANRQLSLVNQLLDLSKLDAGKMNLQASKEDFIPFIKGVVHAYESLAKQKNIDLKIVCPDGELPLYFNRDKMEKIFFNLLSNAFKFTPSGGQVFINLKKKKEKAVVTISDTGIGISEEKLLNIFDRFFQADSGENDMQEGSGIGLALVKELVQLHGGNIKVESQLGKGTVFSIEFPLGKSHLQPHEIVEGIPGNPMNDLVGNWTLPQHSAITGIEIFEQNPAPKSAPHILIIEDNDDVRAFIRLRLEQSFQITEAINGQLGIEKAINLMPDLIISDVMMPQKNGYEVCQTLKTDIRTSHIPIILLTAKAAQEEKLEGLGTGADDYLTKPFDSKELEVRAKNLISLRQQLRERFAESISLKPSEVVTNSIDQTFLENAMQIVEANIGNEQFGIEMLAREISMSRPNLNRKLRALINQSSNQFIQSVRLQRAADLLRQQAGTVSEIAFQTGFSSTAYFVKCFKDHFGETPGIFLKKL